MGGQDSDKTEEPTEHKLQEARKKGQVMKSQEVISTLLLVAVTGVMMGAGPMMLGRIREFTIYVWRLIPDFNLAERNFFGDVVFIMGTILMVLAPLLAGAFLMALLANIAQVKFIFSTEPLKPSLNKINPIEGFKRIFSAKSLMELVKQVAKLTIVGWICYKVVSGVLPELRTAPTMPLTATLALVFATIKRLVGQVLIGMIAIAAVDYMFQHKQFMKQMRMSMQELKDEYKDTEGNPQVKAKIRQLMRQGAQGRMMEEVPNASAVVTNPTHYAVALRYEQGTDPVPVVVAKGENLIARQIKVMAEDHEVPIVENVELARALFKACEIGGAVPTEMYKAVAEVLAYVIKLKRKRELLRRRRLARSAPQVTARPTAHAMGARRAGGGRA
ncbi:MAG: flagellar biosynthesis protein FlhB [Candidatus Xenobium sp.]|jgi:flagellar biosynthetic protein FliR/FlhB|nr:flagellar biosynthesis protein FlhB [Burkholderiales bacterium]